MSEPNMGSRFGWASNWNWGLVNRSANPGGSAPESRQQQLPTAQEGGGRHFVDNGPQPRQYQPPTVEEEADEHFANYRQRPRQPSTIQEGVNEFFMDQRQRPTQYQPPTVQERIDRFFVNRRSHPEQQDAWGPRPLFPEREPAEQRDRQHPEPERVPLLPRARSQAVPEPALQPWARESLFRRPQPQGVPELASRPNIQHPEQRRLPLFRRAEPQAIPEPASQPRERALPYPARWPRQQAAAPQPAPQPVYQPTHQPANHPTNHPTYNPPHQPQPTQYMYQPRTMLPIWPPVAPEAGPPAPPPRPGPVDIWDTLELEWAFYLFWTRWVWILLWAYTQIFADLLIIEPLYWFATEIAPPVLRYTWRFLLAPREELVALYEAETGVVGFVWAVGGWVRGALARSVGAVVGDVRGGVRVVSHVVRIVVPILYWAMWLYFMFHRIPKPDGHADFAVPREELLVPQAMGRGQGAPVTWGEEQVVTGYLRDTHLWTKPRWRHTFDGGIVRLADWTLN